MTNYLKTKQDWKDRRVKIGTPTERDYYASKIRRIKNDSKEHPAYCGCSNCGCSNCELQTEQYMPDKYLMWFIVGIIAVLLLLIIGTKADACGTRQPAFTDENKVLAVLGESEGESQTAKEAIACSINNRGTLRGVYGIHAYRVIHGLYSRQSYINSWIAVEMAQDKNYCEGLVHGAQYWGSIKLDQAWIKTMIKAGYKQTARIGGTVFYRKDK